MSLPPLSITPCRQDGLHCGISSKMRHSVRHRSIQHTYRQEESPTMSTYGVQLRADLYNAPAIPIKITLPDGTLGMWQPTVLTLISGQSSAVLVDTLFTHDQGVAIGDWLDETLGNKTLSTI